MAVSCEAVAVVIAIVVFVDSGDGTGAGDQAAAVNSEPVVMNYDDHTLPTVPYTDASCSKRAGMGVEVGVEMGVTGSGGAPRRPKCVSVRIFDTGGALFLY